MRCGCFVFREKGDGCTAALVGRTWLILAGLLVIFLVRGTERPVHAQGWANVEGECIRVLDVYGTASGEGEIQIVLVMDRGHRPKVFPLKEPPRLVIDLEPVELVGKPRLSKERLPLLRGPVRWGIHHAKRRLRIVLDLFPNRTYDVKQDLYMGPGQLGEGGRFVLTLREISSP
jgi:hypothetical protein